MSLKPMVDLSNNPHLEPRVAKLEVGLDRLTEDVRSLAGIVRDQGSNVEKQLQALTVAVTEAQAPRKTDWSLIISGILLMMAIGSAVFWPLNQTSQLNKEAIDGLAIKFETHIQADGHPVGIALINQLNTRVSELESQTRINTERDKNELQLWREKAVGLLPVCPQVTTPVTSTK